MKSLIVLLISIMLLSGCGKSGSNGADGINGSNGAAGSDGLDGKIVGGSLYLVASKEHSPVSFVDASYTAKDSITVSVPSNIFVVFGEAGTANNSVRVQIHKGNDVVTCKYDGDGYRYVFNSCDDNSGAGSQHQLAKKDVVNFRVLKGDTCEDATSALLEMKVSVE